MSVVVEDDAGALAPGAGTDSVSSKSSKFRTGAGTASGALLAAFDGVVDERVWLVVVAVLEVVVRRGEDSYSPASYSSNSLLVAEVLSRNPLLPPPEDSRSYPLAFVP